VPTLAEQGIAGVDVTGPWFVLMAPAGTPAAALARLNQEANAILALPEIRDKLLAVGVEARGGTLAEAERAVREANARYSRIVAQFGIKGD
jgi:tripartite-type tricarboxylate transporter receptor subunit TctC